MPIFAVNIPEKLFDAIRELIERGHYQTLERFLEVAAYNQIALERGTAPDQIIGRGHRRAQAAPAQPDGPKAGVNGTARGEAKRVGLKNKSRKKTGKLTKKREAAEPGLTVNPVEILGRWAMPQSSEMPAQVKAAGLAAGEHLWGQVNRLFPIKLACRWVAKAAAKGAWPGYLSLADDLANEATSVGEILERWDAEADRKRDEVLATGLPRRGNSASRDRFISQNLARVTRGANVVPGAVCLYALADCTEAAVSLTAEGVEFATLQNPVLDRHDAASPTTLSLEESAFLCRHIKAHVPGEHADMTAVLAALRKGQTTPPTLANGIRNSFPAHWGDGDFRAHMSGLVARLADLRLLRRRWEGRYVCYELGDEKLVESFM